MIVDLQQVYRQLHIRQHWADGNVSCTIFKIRDMEHNSPRNIGRLRLPCLLPQSDNDPIGSQCLYYLLP